MFCLLNKNSSSVEDYAPYTLHSTDEYIYLPRNILKYKYNKDILTYIDKRFEVSPIDKYEFISNLRPEQVHIMDTLLNFYNSNGHINGILHARPGFGKTICSIYLAAHLNKKALIIIDTIKIAEQWKEEILKHTNLKDSDVGLIKGKTFDVEDKKFVITTPQTLGSKVKNNIKDFYPKFRDIGFDIIFYDECHKMGTKYASSSLLFNTKNVIGLSATPYLDKEKDILVKSIFDDILITYGTYDYQPIVKFIKFDSGLGIKYGKRISYLWNKNFIQARSIYNSKLTESADWMDAIYSITKKEVSENNKIIIICLTKKQLNFIYDYLKEKNLSPTKLFSEKNDVDKVNDNVIVATYKYASHAFDYAALSRLILATPIMGKKSLIQTIGRIVRKSDNKKNAIVYDLIDSDSRFNDIFIRSIQIKINILENEFESCTFENI
jgi:superfamily II DNA or RNA helicase